MPDVQLASIPDMDLETAETIEQRFPDDQNWFCMGCCREFDKPANHECNDDYPDEKWRIF
ncbi:hypothetical protein [Neptuniibacter sp.]|uniref:hypothetical protein n=1 Tax=Neptuniibacter sp. TaxID=1962643 RepID=UPI0026344CCE|nr:hypothetical protein [Neptuniibacter sp.]MCP4596183.1 hypothetical protein [Neptuniibacter sp.]